MENNCCFIGTSSKLVTEGNYHRVNLEDLCTIQLEEFLIDLKTDATEYTPDGKDLINAARINELFQDYCNDEMLAKFLVSVYHFGLIMLSNVVDNFKLRRIINASNIEYIMEYTRNNLDNQEDHNQRLRFGEHFFWRCGDSNTPVDLFFRCLGSIENRISK